MNIFRGELLKVCPVCDFKWAELYLIPEQVFITTCKGCGHKCGYTHDTDEYVEFFQPPKVYEEYAS